MYEKYCVKALSKLNPIDEYFFYSSDSPEVIKISESPITNHSIRIPDSPDAGISAIRRRISHAVARNSCNDPCVVEDSPDPNEAVKSRSSFQNGVVVTTPLLFEED